MFLGEVRLFACQELPDYWIPCDGRLLPVHQNTALFALFGSRYGGDGHSTFAIPNLPPLAALGGGQVLYGMASTGAFPRGAIDGMLSVIQPFPQIAGLPANWLPCDGRALNIADYLALYSVMGTRFGGDGLQTFNLPDIAPLPSGDVSVPYFICVDGFTPGPDQGIYLDYISAVIAFGGNFTTSLPRGTAVAFGIALSQSENRELFQLLGTRFGGGSNFFFTPNLPPLNSGDQGIQSLIFTEGIYPRPN